MSFCLMATLSCLPATSNSACCTSCATKLCCNCLRAAVPGLGHAFLAALYCTHTCAKRSSNFAFDTVSVPTAATAVVGSFLSLSELELPPQALMSNAVEQRAKPASGTRRRPDRCMGQPCE